MNEEGRLDLREVEEGDRVTMMINAHDFQRSGTCLTGTVKKMPREEDIEMIYSEDRGRPMADLKVESDEGTVWTWNADNGYVIGPVDHPERPNRSDIGRFRGLWEPEDPKDLEILYGLED